MSRVEGKVQWFNETKGYGFILRGNTQYFVHYAQIQMDGYRTLERDARVSFEPCEGPRGLFAQNVEVIS